MKTFLRAGNERFFSSNFDELYFFSEKELNREEVKWWKDNWWKLDLIDPEKWALFPGDVVKVVNPTHGKLVLIAFFC